MQSDPINISPLSDSAVSEGAYAIDVSVIVVNYNVREFLEQAIRSIKRAIGGLAVEIIVVDNNSVDGSPEMVSSDFPDVHLIGNRENIGFGRANNLAIDEARGRYLLILNPDTIVQEDTLTAMTEFLDTHPDAGAVGCQIRNPDGSFARESRRAFPTPDVAFYRMIGLSRLFPSSKRFGRYNMTFLPEDEVAEVDALSGSCMMIRAEALQRDRSGDDSRGAGTFDERFFMYGEDLDLCYRIQQAGWKIYYFPGTQIIHYKGESTRKGELRYVRLFYGAMLLFIDKHFDVRRSGFFRVMLRLGIMGRAGLSVIASVLHRLAAPAIDFVLVYATVTSLGLLRSIVADAGLAKLFFYTVSPAYAIGAVLGIWAFDGYVSDRSWPLKPVFTGLVVSFLVVATAAFFVPAMAFSRLVVGLSLPVSALLLLTWRFFSRNRDRAGRHAVLVGTARDAVQMAATLEPHPRPPFLLAGFVSDEDSAPAINGPGPRRLGHLGHLRDLVRLRKLNDIVFSAGSLSNQTIFQTMIGLQDLGVRFWILHESGNQIIGKSNVSDLLPESGLVQLPEIVVLRTPGARRSFETVVAVAGLFLLPLLFVMWPILHVSRHYRFLLGRLTQMPDILTRRKALIGFDPDHAFLIPVSWKLKPGVFSITNTMRSRELDDADFTRAYWYYVTHQSAGLDIDIIMRSLRNPPNAD